MIVLLALALGCAALLTVTATPAKPGSGLGGAVYLPVVVIVPIALGLTPDGGVNDQVTAVLAAPVTVAVNCRFPFTTTVTALLGSIVTVTGAAAAACAVNHESETTIIASNARTLIPPSLGRIRFRQQIRAKHLDVVTTFDAGAVEVQRPCQFPRALTCRF